MTIQYKGMRWLKCDLHMHTPADARNWTGEMMVDGGEANAAATRQIWTSSASLIITF